MRFIQKSVRYCGVSAFCFILHNLILIVGMHMGLNYVLSTLVSFGVVTTAAYFAHCRFTFSAAPRRAAYLAYMMAMAFNIPLTLLLLWITISLMGLPVTIAAPVAAVLSLCPNYIASLLSIRMRGPHPKETVTCR